MRSARPTTSSAVLERGRESHRSGAAALRPHVFRRPLAASSAGVARGFLGPVLREPPRGGAYESVRRAAPRCVRAHRRAVAQRSEHHARALSALCAHADLSAVHSPVQRRRSTLAARHRCVDRALVRADRARCRRAARRRGCGLRVRDALSVDDRNVDRGVSGVVPRARGVLPQAGTLDVRRDRARREHDQTESRLAGVRGRVCVSSAGALALVGGGRRALRGAIVLCRAAALFRVLSVSARVYGLRSLQCVAI